MRNCLPDAVERRIAQVLVVHSELVGMLPRHFRINWRVAIHCEFLPNGLMSFMIGMNLLIVELRKVGTAWLLFVNRTILLRKIFGM